MLNCSTELQTSPSRVDFTLDLNNICVGRDKGEEEKLQHSFSNVCLEQAIGLRKLEWIIRNVFVDTSCQASTF